MLFAMFLLRFLQFGISLRTNWMVFDAQCEKEICPFGGQIPDTSLHLTGQRML